MPRSTASLPPGVVTSTSLVHEHAVLRGLDQDFEGGALDAQAEQRRIDPDVPGLARLDLDQDAPALVTQASVLSRLGDRHDQPALGAIVS